MISIPVLSSSRRGSSTFASLQPQVISWLLANVGTECWKFRIDDNIAIIDFVNDIDATQFKLTWC